MDNFVITIARTYGSGGRTVGKMLAKDLGISYYNREILKLASDDSGINEALFAKVDEKLKNTLLFKTASSVYNGEIIPPDKGGFTSDRNLFNYQAKIIKELSNKESFVVIGRAADFVLKDFKNVIRVFVHAPMETCIKNVIEVENRPEKGIEAYIKKIDKERAEYYKYYTGRDWYDAKNYDLCLNSAELSFEKCVDIIKAYIDIKMS